MMRFSFIRKIVTRYIFLIFFAAFIAILPEVTTATGIEGELKEMKETLNSARNFIDQGEFIRAKEILFVLNSKKDKIKTKDAQLYNEIDVLNYFLRNPKGLEYVWNNNFFMNFTNSNISKYFGYRIPNLRFDGFYESVRESENSFSLITKNLRFLQNLNVLSLSFRGYMPAHELDIFNSYCTKGLYLFTSIDPVTIIITTDGDKGTIDYCCQIYENSMNCKIKSHINNKLIEGVKYKFVQHDYDN